MTPPRRTIVVVEDDPQIRLLIERVLATGDYEVVATEDPLRAQALVKEHRPALVLCDIAMPGLDGYGVLRALQADPDTARAPVVFLTAHHEFSERVRAFRFGVVDYLTKPFTPTVLLRKVEKVLETLARRSGVVGEGVSARELLEEVKRDVRTGVLTVNDESGEQARVVLHAGQVVEGTASSLPAGPAVFAELDASHADIAPHDPRALPLSSTSLPTFSDIPQVLRLVLVVDDNQFFRFFLRQVLSAQGFTVHEARNASEGLAMALEHRPWLILSDVRMPGADGFVFCEEVRAHSLLRQTPFLFLSGWDDYKARYHGLELGADDFLSKETPVRELLMRMQLVLRRHLDLGRRDPRSGMHGQLDVMGAPGVLQVCHLTGLTGMLSAQAGGERVDVGFRAGEIVFAQAGALRGVEAVYAFLAWEKGTFQFAPGDPGPDEPLGDGFNQIVLDGCRRLDEARAGGPTA